MAVVDLISKTFAPLPGVHQGTGPVSGMAHVVDPKSVDADIDSQLDILFESFAIQVLSFEIDTKRLRTGSPLASRRASLLSTL
jgi:hypothetical protein